MRPSTSSRPPFPSVVFVVLAFLAAPGVVLGQDDSEPAADTVPSYMERIEENRRRDFGIIRVGAELEALGVSTVGGAVARMVPGVIGCEPVVYWNGVRMLERWHPQRGVVAETPLARVHAIEIYLRDREARLPLEYREHECGAIALWVETASSEDTTTTLAKLGLVLLAAVVFFLAVGP